MSSKGRMMLDATPFDATQRNATRTDDGGRGEEEMFGGGPWPSLEFDREDDGHTSLFTILGSVPDLFIQAQRRGAQ